MFSHFHIFDFDILPFPPDYGFIKTSRMANTSEEETLEVKASCAFMSEINAKLFDISSYSPLYISVYFSIYFYACYVFPIDVHIL